MSQPISYKVANNLFLVRLQPPRNAAPAKPVETATNHVLIVDVSGSMWGEIDKVRDHIKTKLPKMMKDGDTLSLIAFSGRGQFWRILTAEPVATLADLSAVNEQIDRWLRPVGLTGFKEPIEEADRLVAEISKKNKNPFSLFFMSDGCDNQWSRADIVKAVEKTAGGLAAATVVEYGYYADRPLLTQMAEKWGGTLIFSDNFTKFAPILDAAIQRRVIGGKKIEIKVEGDPIGGFAYALKDGELYTFSVENGNTINVPEDTTDIAYLSPSPVGAIDNLASAFGTTPKLVANEVVAATYGAVSLFAVRSKPDIVLALLKVTGDVTFIEQFSTLFGKQKYSEFQEATKVAAFDTTKRLTKGYDPNKVPRDDAYTVLEFLKTLQSDDANRVLLGHSTFKYNRIGRGRVDAGSKLTDAEQTELKTLTEQLSKEKDVAKIKEINSKVAALTNKPDPLKFVEDKDEKGDGYPVNCLTFNEDRANVSIQIRKEGTVDLSGRLPEEFKGKGLGKIPETFRTFCFRNYAIVKDGLVNVSALPVKLTDATKATLAKAVSDGRMPADAIREEGGVTVIALSQMPVINRKMVQTASARVLFEKQWELTKARAAQKVYNAFMKEHFPGKKSEGFAALYGEEGAKWLADQGITDYSGFGPKMVQSEASDVYMAKCLEVKLKGYSSIPSLNDFKKQATKGKFNGPAQLMKPAVDEVDAFMKSDVYTKAPNKDEVFETWLDGKCTAATKEARKLLFDIAQIKFSVIVGQVWFTEFPTINENSLELTLDSTKLNFAAEMREVEEKI